MRPYRGTVIDQGEVVLDMAVRAEHERLGARVRGEMLHVLRRQAVHPGQPVGAPDPHHTAVAAVGKADRSYHGPLLGDRIAVVRGDADVRLVGGDRSSGLQQRAWHGTQTSVRVRPRGPSTAVPRTAGTCTAVPRTAGMCTAVPRTAGMCTAVPVTAVTAQGRVRRADRMCTGRTPSDAQRPSRTRARGPARPPARARSLGQPR